VPKSPGERLEPVGRVRPVGEPDAALEARVDDGDVRAGVLGLYRGERTGGPQPPVAPVGGGERALRPADRAPERAVPVGPDARGRVLGHLPPDDPAPQPPGTPPQVGHG
jgi:hypothetical protein